MKSRKRSYTDFLLEPPPALTKLPSPVPRPNLLSEPGSLDKPRNAPKSGRLCPGCANIDFKKIFSLPSTVLGPTGVTVSRIRKDFDPDCGFCTLVLSLGLDPDGIASRGYYLFAIDCLRVLRLRRTLKRRESDPSVVLLALYGIKVRYKVNSIITAINNGVIVPVSPLTSDTQGQQSGFGIWGRKVDHAKVGFELVRYWLEDCKCTRDVASQNRRAKLEGLPFVRNVIDCFTRDVVEPPKGDEYLTLSYVWGKEGNREPTQDGNWHILDRIDTPAPATIEDAMCVVREVGQRYLWVDRYCIPASRHDEDQNLERHFQIQNMDVIYEDALATIVAVSGTGANAGLPGVSLKRRAQNHVETNAGTLVSTLKPLPVHLSSSEWVRRGWTYQEGLLSRRCLFVTDEQIFFGCKERLRAESNSQSSAVVSDSSRDTLSPSLMLSAELRTHNVPISNTTFADHVREHTSRSLSREADGLNAFRGMLARTRYRSYWGLQFRLVEKLPSDEAIKKSFVKSLLWKSLGVKRGKTTVTRRSMFPTWCWASLDAKVEVDASWADGPAASNDVLIGIEDPSGAIRNIADIFKDTEKQGQLLKEVTPYLYITAFMTRVSFTFPAEGERSLWDCSITFKLHGFGKRQLSIEIYIDESTDTSLIQRLQQQEWDVIAMMEKRLWLILDRKNGVAVRLGCFCFLGFIFNEGGFEGEVKNIKLG